MQLRRENENKKNNLNHRPARPPSDTNRALLQLLLHGRCLKVKVLFTKNGAVFLELKLRSKVDRNKKMEEKSFRTEKYYLFVRHSGR